MCFSFSCQNGLRVPHCRYIRPTDSLHLLAYLCAIKPSVFPKRSSVADVLFGEGYIHLIEGLTLRSQQNESVCQTSMCTNVAATNETDPAEMAEIVSDINLYNYKQRLSPPVENAVE